MIEALVQGNQKFPNFIKQLTNLSVRKGNNSRLKLRTHIGPKYGANGLWVVVNWHPGMRTAGLTVRIMRMLLTRPTDCHLLTGTNCAFGHIEILKNSHLF